MPHRSEPWPAGAPCWADNHIDDLDRARDFYGAVLGWQIDDPDLNAGNFASARVAGRPVAGFLVGVEGAQPGWHVFFASDDIEATATAITDHGGTGLFGPHEVPPSRGKFHLASDPGGAVFGVWQAGSLTGTGLYDEHGAIAWEHLQSTDPDAAQNFYRDVFDWGTAGRDAASRQHNPDGKDVLFHLANDPDAPLGEIGGLDPTTSSDEKSQWLVYFVVDDVDAALTQASAHGGSVVGAAHDGPYGRIAGVADPFGAGFAIVAPTAFTPPG